MHQNGYCVVRTRKHRLATDSNHKFNIVSNQLDSDFTANKAMTTMQSKHSALGWKKPWLSKQGLLN